MRTVIIPLAIELRRVVGDVEEDFQDLSVGDLSRVVGDLDGFRMARFTGSDHFVVGRGGVAAGVAGDNLLNAFDVLIHGFDTPEASAGQHRRLFGCGCLVISLVVNDGIGKVSGS